MYVTKCAGWGVGDGRGAVGTKKLLTEARYPISMFHARSALFPPVANLAPPPPAPAPPPPRPRDSRLQQERNRRPVLQLTELKRLLGVNFIFKVIGIATFKLVVEGTETSCTAASGRILTSRLGHYQM